MLAAATAPSMLALFSLGGGEIILILCMILILFGAKKLPPLARGLGEGISRFRDEVGRLSKGLDDEAQDAGESLGGIYGKPAAQALTPDNQTAELYDPAVFQKPPATKRMRFRGWTRLWRSIWRIVSRLFIRRT
jgi:sec-independent protein translocase protein TatA